MAFIGRATSVHSDLVNEFVDQALSHQNFACAIPYVAKAGDFGDLLRIVDLVPNVVDPSLVAELVPTNKPKYATN